MAYAFFTTPTLNSLATFGFGGTKPTPSDSNQSQDQLTPTQRPVSESAGAIIKCSDCGGDVPLMELGEHVCSAPAPPASSNQFGHSPSPSSRKNVSKHISRSSVSTTVCSKPSTSSSPPRSPSSRPDPSPPPVTQPTLSLTRSKSPLRPKSPPTRPRSPVARPKSPPNLRQRSRRDSPKHTPRIQQSSSSDSSMTTSDSSILTGSSQGSRSRMPFLEKYAQLVQTNNNTRLPSSSTPSLDKMNSKDRWNESSHSRNLSNSTSTSTSSSNNSTDPKRTIKPKLSKKLITPPTSPEISPSDKIGFASLQRSQLRNDRSGGLGIQASSSMPSNLSKKRLGHGDEHSRTNKPSTRALPSSQSASAGLDKLLASDAFHSSNFDTEESDKRFETPKNRSKGKSSKKGDKDTDELEDLMGDLLSEMSRKAEMSTYQLKEKRLRKNSDSTSTNHQSTPNKYSPHARSVTESDANPIEDYDRDLTPRIRGRKKSTNEQLPIVTPDSPGIRPSDSISQLGFEHPPSPPAARALFAPKSGVTEDRCHHCGKRTDSKNSKIRESSIAQNGTTKAMFCHSCYAELYLPKCRKCDRPIERSAVTDRVGKVLGKYHPDCFNCFKCSAKFPNGEFYVWDRKPVCSHHYHRLAGTVCANESCGRGIEGPCVSLSLESNDTSHPGGSSSLSNKSNIPQRRLYHPEHFTCTRRGCKSSLEEFHFVINFQPWCERHAHQQYAAMAQPPPSHQPNADPWPRQPPSGQSSFNNNYDDHHPSSNSKYAASSRTMERRRTIIQNVRDR